MAKLKLVGQTRGTYFFRCPGCKSRHMVWTKNEGYNHPTWQWNGSTEKPTFTPSLKVTASYPEGMHICHSFITDGKIQYLSDCTHELAGQMIELPDIQ